jgi:hypothetical protein
MPAPPGTVAATTGGAVAAEATAAGRPGTAANAVEAPAGPSLSTAEAIAVAAARAAGLPGAAATTCAAACPKDAPTRLAGSPARAGVAKSAALTLAAFVGSAAMREATSVAIAL